MFRSFQTGILIVLVLLLTPTLFNNNTAMRAADQPNAFSASLAEDPGLVGSWSFNEGSGTAVGDSSGNGNDGVIYGATWVSGVNGYALRFDGSSDYVRVPSSTSIQSISDEMTLVVLAKTHSYQVNTVLMMSSTDSTPPENRMHFVSTHPDLADDKVRFTQFRPDTSYWYANFEFIPDLNDWILYHVVVHSNGDVEFYVNGTLTDISSGAPGFYSDNLEGAYFGTDLDNGVPTDFFDGDLDQLSLYNRPLSTFEIVLQYYQLFGLITTTTTSSETTTPTTPTPPPGPEGIDWMVLILVGGGGIGIGIIIVIIIFSRKRGLGGAPAGEYEW